MHTRDEPLSEAKPWRLLLLTALAGLVFGLLGLGQIAEDVLRTLRNGLHTHQASGDIVIVKIDNSSIRDIGRWPWPRRQHAQLIDQLSKAGATRIFIDLQFHGESSPLDDRVFADSLRRSGRVILAAKGVWGPNTSGKDEPPLPMFAEQARLGSISASYNYQNAIWRLDYSRPYQTTQLPSFAALLANRTEGPRSAFLIDYSLDPASIPTLSASAVGAGRFDPDQVRGKDVIIGGTTDALGDVYFVPGTGKMGGVYVQAMGAETLKSGTPVDLGWVPAFLAALAIAAWAFWWRSARHQLPLLAGSAAALLVGPALLESRLISLEVMPALFVLTLIATALLRRGFRERGLVDSVSGLPNLTALKAARAQRDKALIAARILNYAEIVATLPANSEKQLVDQVVSRLSVGAPARVHYHGDGGIFAWFEDPKMPFGHHLEALYALFRNPVRVEGMPIDLSISFGVEIGSSRSLANRLGSALLAAEEAAHDGLKWKYYDPDSQQDASWRLSMLSQLDDAIDHREVWIAYQPKVDLKSRRIVGAEALARWTHPDKGPIAASEFVAAAEQHDRIGKLTAFVLEEAIVAAASLNHGRDFEIAVNLSGRLLGDRGLVGRVAILLDRHGLEARHLTLELTETAALAGSGDALDMLAQLRELGVNISIDDYGTGLSTLDYLKRIPAGEIKIDQSFIKGMTDSRSERLMVQSTIALAHSLGRTVVAEGVETRDALDLLAEMECDTVQGFIVGRPMSLESLRRRLVSERRSRVA